MKKKKFRLPRKLKKRVKKERVNHNWHSPFPLDRLRKLFDEREFKLQVLDMPDVLKLKAQEERFGIVHVEVPKTLLRVRNYFYI